MAVSSATLNSHISLISQNDNATVVLRGGLIVPLVVLQVLWEFEDRGARFELKDDGGFRVIPPSVLTANDIAVLKAHREEARQVLEYQAPECDERSRNRLPGLSILGRPSCQMKLE
jgi:hypothetical protein